MLVEPGDGWHGEIFYTYVPSRKIVIPMEKKITELDMVKAELREMQQKMALTSSKKDNLTYDAYRGGEGGGGGEGEGEIYIQRVKQSLAKKMRSQWNVLLSIEYLSSINCWATLNDLQNVIPFHGDRFAEIILNSSIESAIVSPHNLSFCTSFTATVLFLMVKASRPITFQYLTVEMFTNIDSNGFIDQTLFKTKDKYGFDSINF